MAVVADIDDLDLVIEPYECTREDREAFRHAVEEHRRRVSHALLSERARDLLARHSTSIRKSDHPSSRED